MFASVIVRNDLCTDRMEPVVSTGVIKMPMRVDQVCDGLGADTRQRFSELRARNTNSAINKHLSVGTRQNGNIATGAFNRMIGQAMGRPDVDGGVTTATSKAAAEAARAERAELVKAHVRRKLRANDWRRSNPIRNF